MEMQMVHKDVTSGKMLVVALMFDTGEANEYLATFWAKFPLGTASTVDAKIAAPYDNVISGGYSSTGVPNFEYFMYEGSTTAPPHGERPVDRRQKCGPDV